MFLSNQGYEAREFLFFPATRRRRGAWSSSKNGKNRSVTRHPIPDIEKQNFTKLHADRNGSTNIRNIRKIVSRDVCMSVCLYIYLAEAALTPPFDRFPRFDRAKETGTRWAHDDNKSSVFRLVPETSVRDWEIREPSSYWAPSSTSINHPPISFRSQEN